MKHLESGNFKSAWGGIAGLSVALPVMWTEASARGFKLRDVARWMSEAPAKLAGCDARKGKIASGMDADFVIFDDDAEFAVTPARLHYRHPVSAYMGETLRGVVKATYVRGAAAYVEGRFPGDPTGREFRK
jgi:allantoinase